MYRAPKLTNNSFHFGEKKRTEEKSLAAMEFPELSQNKRSTSSGIVQTRYLDAISKEKDMEEIKSELNDGWARLSWDEITGKLVIEKKEKEIKKQFEIPFHDHVCKEMNKMFGRWDKYKKEYIELYGEDAYPEMKQDYEYHYATEEEDELYDDNTDMFMDDVNQ